MSSRYQFLADRLNATLQRRHPRPPTAIGKTLQVGAGAVRKFLRTAGNRRSHRGTLADADNNG